MSLLLLPRATFFTTQLTPAGWLHSTLASNNSGRNCHFKKVILPKLIIFNLQQFGWKTFTPIGSDLLE
jgi:hypothetical protein